MTGKNKIVRTPLAALILCGWIFSSHVLVCAQEGQPPPQKDASQGSAQSSDAKMVEEFLAAARAKYVLHCEAGLESFGVKIKIFGAGGDQPGGRERRGGGRRGGGGGGGQETLHFLLSALPQSQEVVTYEWETPDIEEIGTGSDLQGGQQRGQSRGMMQGALRGLWKDVVAGCVFPDLEAPNRKMEGTDEGIVITCTGEDGSEASIVFDPDSKIVIREEKGGDNRESVIVPTYVPVNGLLRLQSKTVSRAGRDGEGMESSYTYSGYRTISGYDLPTQLSVNFGRTAIEMALEYIHINGEDAEVEAIDPKVVKAAAKEFEKRYSKWSDPEKIDAMKKLAALDHDVAALSIAKKGLADKSLTVREKTAELLGRMGRRNVVANLVKAMKANEDEIGVYVAVVTALGRIGDPKAIPHLSKDFWGFKERSTAVQAGQAKLSALGMIRSRKSVEALIDLLYKFGRGRQGTGRLVADAIRALRTLTGQDFGQERDDWKDWWKKNKTKFKLEEDS